MIIPRRKPYFPPGVLKSLISLSFRKNKNNEVNLLEKELENKLDIPNPVLVSSGRVGLYLILKASNLKKGSEIIMPGYTFGLLVNFIKKAGYKPVPVDADPLTFQMSPLFIKKAITKNTKAIIATHLFGEPCDIKAIVQIAKSKNILLIEDCAESLGSTVNGKLTGTFGDVALSSFDIAKPLQGIRGGLIFGNNKKLISKIRVQISKAYTSNNNVTKEVVRAMLGYVVSQTFFWPILMYIFSFDYFRKVFVSTYRAADKPKNYSTNSNPYLANITRLNLTEFKKRLFQRRYIKSLYIKHLSGYLNFQKSYPNTKSSVYMIVAKCKMNPLKVRRHLAISGIDIAIYDEIVDDCLNKPNSNIQKFSKQLIALPVYESLKDKDVLFVSNKIKSIWTNKTHL